MARITSKRQVTVPKVIADRYGIEPGDEVEFLPAGDTIRMQPATGRTGSTDRAAALARFDAATERQRSRDALTTLGHARDRGWSRDELYDRGRAR